MKPSEGYQQTEAATGGEMIEVAGNGEALVTGPVGHPVLSGEPVTGCSGRSKSFL